MMRVQSKDVDAPHKAGHDEESIGNAAQNHRHLDPARK